LLHNLSNKMHLLKNGITATVNLPCMGFWKREVPKNKDLSWNGTIRRINANEEVMIEPLYQICDVHRGNGHVCAYVALFSRVIMNGKWR